MLRCAILLVVCLAAAQATRHTADKVFVERQKTLYELFFVNQPVPHHLPHYQKARSFNLVENVHKYHDQEAVQEVIQRVKHNDLVPRGNVFSVLNEKMREEAVLVFRLLYAAENFDTFTMTAWWARMHVNEQLYLYALSTAAIHRPDTRYLKIPPLYEVAPHFFFNSEVMQKAYQIAMGDTDEMKKITGGVNQYVIPANYSGWYLTRYDDPEQCLTYFTEDVGLAMYYYLVNHDFPFWMSSQKYNLPSNVRGELYFFGHKQLLGRYYLERLSNNLGEVEYVDIDAPIQQGYYPTMHHRSGLLFPQRQKNSHVPMRMFRHVMKLKDLHTRIMTAIDLGVVVNKTGHHVTVNTPLDVNLLGCIVQGNEDTVSKTFYGDFDATYRKILGFGLETKNKYHVQPSALEFFSTSVRDPIFYRMYKNILSYYHSFKATLPKYTTEDLRFTGVKLNSVVVDKLVTFFEPFDSLLSNGVSVKTQDNRMNVLIKARQQRLNHKPFTYHLTVTSDRDTKAMVRIFLGPKYDNAGVELDLEENYANFVVVDRFMVDLKQRVNKIERHDYESVYVVPDEPASDVFYKKVNDCVETSCTNFAYDTHVYGFPSRLLLPKGKKEGMPLKLFVIVSPVEESEQQHIDSRMWGPRVVDHRPMGFPMDRPVDSKCFNLDNMMFTDVVVHHKQLEELNVTA